MPEPRWRLGAVFFLVTGMVLTVGCGGPPAPADAAARVDGEIIPYADFEQFVSGRVGLEAASSSLVLSGLLDQFLDEVLLRRLAVEEDLVDVSAPGWRVVDRLLASRAPVPVSDVEVTTFYRAHADDFERPERIVLRQILAEKQDVAGEIATRLSAGADVAGLATEFAEIASISEGEIVREDLPVAFVEAIFALEVGEVSEVLGADYGFHVFQVVERLPAERISLAEARDRIVDQLSRQGRRRQVESLVSEARRRYNVVVFGRNLPFNYEGQYESNP